MLLLAHILIATSNIIFTGYTYLRPTKQKLYGSYALVTLTFATGFYLIFTQPAHMVQTCFTGITYLAIVTVGIFSARHKLAAQHASHS